MFRYTVIVDLAAHDDVKVGNICTMQSFCTVLAANDVEAQLVAAQLASTVHGLMPTRTEIEGMVL